MELFTPERIVNREGYPEYFAHGPRQIEVLEGGEVRVLFCRDQPTMAAIAGRPVSIPVFAVVVPIACLVWNLTATHQWVFDRGFMRTHPVGPTALHPKRALMM